MRSKSIIIIIVATVFLLLIPLLAMQFNDNVNWTPIDFVVAGLLLLGAGFAYEFMAGRAQNRTYRTAVGLAVGASLLLIWANLAVGIIGAESNPANLMYFGVIIIGIIGAVFARLRPLRMSRALFAMAIAQTIAAVIGLIIWNSRFAPEEGSLGMLRLIGVNLFFILLFVGSAILFRRADAA
jgi:hypothetical protein